MNVKLFNSKVEALVNAEFPLAMPVIVPPVIKVVADILTLVGLLIAVTVTVPLPKEPLPAVAVITLPTYKPIVSVMPLIVAV